MVVLPRLTAINILPLLVVIIDTYVCHMRIARDGSLGYFFFIKRESTDIIRIFTK